MAPARSLDVQVPAATPGALDALSLVAMLGVTVALAAGARLLAHTLGWQASAPLKLPLWRVLVIGPLTETMEMLALAVSLTRALSRRQHDVVAATQVCTAVIGLSFALSHLAQQGAASLLSLPMALWLSLLAAQTAQPGTWMALSRGGLVLVALHGLYNAGLLAMGDR